MSIRPFLRGLLVVVFVATTARAEITITLKNSFIEKFKNRATITTSFTVDKAHKKPNPPSKDADLHIAGRAPEVGLPLVAEIMNAKQFSAAVDQIHEVEGTDEEIPLTGVWRLWCEHGGSSKQIQGNAVKQAKTSNPDHVFEIHPATSVAGIDVLPGFVPIEGYKNKDAMQAFHAYENLSSKITLGANTTTIITRMGGFNYVEFQIKLNEDPQEIADGVMVMAQVQDLDGEMLVRNRRMVFVKDSDPANEVLQLHKGQKLHVLGVPRINLAILSWRIRNGKDRPEVLTWQLPYEMIVVGVFGPGTEEGEEVEEEIVRVDDPIDVLAASAPL